MNATNTSDQIENAINRKFKNRTGLLKWGLVSPTLTLFLLLGVAPTIYVLVLAFSFYSPGQPLEFVGLENFEYLFENEQFFVGIYVTCWLTFFSVGVQLFLGFSLALAFQRVNMKFRRFAITVALIPMMVTPAAITMVFQLMFNERYGHFNYILQSIGLNAVSWRTDPFNSLMSMVITDVWEWTPFILLLLLAGLESLASEFYEAAKIDGANRFQSFIHLTLPLMKPFIFLAVCLRIVDAWKAYDVVVGVTKGGPGGTTESLAFFTWKLGFGVSADRGGAAASSLIQLVLIILVAKFLLSQLTRVSQGK